MSKTCVFFFLSLFCRLTRTEFYGLGKHWPRMPGFRAFVLVNNLKKCKLKQQAIFLVYRIGKYLKWRYYAVLMRVRGIGELVVLVGVQISSIILRSDLTSCSKSWRKEPGGIPLLRISPNRIILGMLKDLSICIFIGTLFNKRKIRKKRNAQ